jgi:opacity protein-like surface antigen
MKKTLLVVVVFFIFLILQGVSFSADSGPYVSGHLGMAFMTDNKMSKALMIGELTEEATWDMEFDPGYEFCVAGGYKWKMFRLEGEIGYQANDIDTINACLGEICVADVSSSGHSTTLSFLANGYLDFVNRTSFTPYITAGIGRAKIEIKDLAIEEFPVGDFEDTVWVYQLGAGVEYAINENFTIDLKYRYLAMADSEFEGIDTEIEIHSIYLGLRYNF